MLPYALLLFYHIYSPMSLNLYPITKQIGSGGFGKTYLAINTLMPSKPECVVKQLVPLSTEPNLQSLIRERFEKEGLVLESLGKNSNGMIPCLYAYFIENNEFYLVQEYIDGDNLRERVERQGLFTEEQVRDLLIGILPTLTYIHKQGIVHRDIKPENIMLRKVNNKPVLIDFGAVKETMSTVVTTSANTEKSIVIGTPGFMPIEQLAGRPVFASDIHALGLTMIYLLTGNKPADIGTDPNTGKINWQFLAPNISQNLKEILEKAIHPIFSDRHKNAEEMLNLLNNQAATQPSQTTVVAPVPDNYTFQKSNDRHPSGNSYVGTPISPLVAVILAAIAGGGLFASGAMLWKNFAGDDSIQNSNRKTEAVSTNPNRSNDNTQNSMPPKLPVESSQIKPSNPSIDSSNIERVGWLRLGAVGSKDGQISVGEQLISTTQPVTISPPRVPSIGDNVKVINSVNVRVNSPQPPNYKLAEQKAALPPGQELVIINTDAFADPKSPSPFTVVWAEVGIKKRN
jgi:serine/threonine protein kinase, bacterial